MRKILLVIALFGSIVLAQAQNPNKNALNQSINDSIRTNGLNKITAQTLNNILHRLANALIDSLQAINAINSQKGLTNGIPQLSGGLVPLSELPPFVDSLRRLNDSMIVFSIHGRGPDTLLLRGTAAGGITDTTSLSARINQKLNASDTASMLVYYLRYGLGVKYTDTASMLAPYIRFALAMKYTDTAGMLAPYLKTINFTATGIGLGHVIDSAQVINGGSARKWMVGPYASRPAAGYIGGLFYLAPDSAKIYYDNGSLWITVSGGTGGVVGIQDTTALMRKANNLSDVVSIPSARANLLINNVDNTSDSTKNVAPGVLKNKVIDGGLNTLQNVPKSAIPTLQAALDSNIKRIDTTGFVTSKLSRQKLADSLAALIGLKLSITDSAGIFSTRAYRQKLADSLAVLIGLKLNITDSSGIYSTRAYRQKLADSLAALINLKLKITDTAGKWVNLIGNNATRDSIIYFIGSTRFAVKVGGIDSSLAATKYGVDTAKQAIRNAIAADTANVNGKTSNLGYTGKFLGSGLYSALPSASTGPGFYYTRDSARIYYSDGTAWTAITDKPGQSFNIYVRGKGQSGDTSYVSASMLDSALFISAIRDSGAVRWIINPDGSRTIYVPGASAGNTDISVSVGVNQDTVKSSTGAAGIIPKWSSGNAGVGDTASYNRLWSTIVFKNDQYAGAGDTAAYSVKDTFFIKPTEITASDPLLTATRNTNQHKISYDIKPATFAITVDNIAAIDIRSANPAYTTIVKGFYTPGDGGGGDFYFVSGSTATAVPGMVIAISGGRLFRRFPGGMLNVLWFGAKGDGTTDDAAAFQTAVNFGGVVFVPNPSVYYRFHNSVKLPSYTHLMGQDKLLTKIVQDSNTVDIGVLIPMYNSHDGVIDGLNITCNDTATMANKTGACIRLICDSAFDHVLTRTIHDWRISNCRFSGYKGRTAGVSMVSTRSTYGGDIYNITTDNCLFDSLGVSGWSIIGEGGTTPSNHFRRMVVTNCRVRHCGLFDPLSGFGIDIAGGGSNNLVDHNYLSDCIPMAIEVVGASSTHVTNNAFDSLYRNPSGKYTMPYDFDCGGSTPGFTGYDNLASGNYTLDTVPSLPAFINQKRFTSSGNVIRAYGAGGGLYTDSVQGASFTGDRFFLANSSAPYTWWLRGHTFNVTIDGSHISGDPGQAALVLAQDTAYNNVFQNCSFSGEKDSSTIIVQGRGAYNNMALFSTRTSKATPLYAVNVPAASAPVNGLVMDQNGSIAQGYFGQGVPPAKIGFVPLNFGTVGVWSYDKYWAATTSNNFVATGTTVSLNGSKVLITGSGNNYSQTYGKTIFSYLEHYTVEDSIVIKSTISGTTYGAGLGISGIANLGWVDFTNTATAGKVYLNTNGTNRVTSSGALTFATGDTIVMKFQRMRDTLSFTATDKANASTQTVSYIVSNAFVYPQGTDLIHKIGQYCVFVKGGQYELEAMKVTDLEALYPQLAIGADSKGQGYFVGSSWNRRLSDQLNSGFAHTENYGSSGDLIANLVARANDIILAHPQQLLLEIGCNDLRSGTTVANLWPAYQGIVGLFQANGIKVYHITYPEGTAIAPQLKQFDSLVRTYYQAEYVPIYDKIRACAACLAPDSIHLTGVGNDTAYSTLMQWGMMAANTYTPAFQTNNLTPLASETVTTNLNLIHNGGNNIPSTGVMQVGTNGASGIPLILLTAGKQIRYNYQATNGNPNILFYNYAGGELGRLLLDSLQNVALGPSAGGSNVSGSYNTYIGTQSGKNNTGSWNTGIGGFSKSFLIGTGNTVGGYQAGYGFNFSTTTSTVSAITAFGTQACKSCATGADTSSAFGYGSLSDPAGTHNYTGSRNLAIGYNTQLPAFNTSDWTNFNELFQGNRPTSRIAQGPVSSVSTMGPTFFQFMPATATYSTILIPTGVLPTGTRTAGEIYSDGTHAYIYLGGAWQQIDRQGGSSAPFTDASALVKNGTDATKLAILSAAGISTGTTRTYGLPDFNGTFAVTNHAQSWSGSQDFSSATVTVATQTAGTNNTTAASTAYADAAVGALTTEKLLYSQTLGNTANTTSETSLTTSGGYGSLSIPSSALTVGKTFRYRCSGTFSTSSTPGNLTIRIKMGSNTIETTTITNLPSSVSNYSFVITGTFIITSTGSSGGVTGDGQIFYSTGGMSAANQSDLFTTGGSTVNTTTSNTFSITAQFAGSTNTMSSSIFTLEALN